MKGEFILKGKGMKIETKKGLPATRDRDDSSLILIKLTNLNKAYETKVHEL